MTNKADEPVTEDDPNAPDRADSVVAKTRRRPDDDAAERSAETDDTVDPDEDPVSRGDLSGDDVSDDADSAESGDDTSDSPVGHRADAGADTDDLADEAGETGPDSPESTHSTEPPEHSESEEHSRVTMARIPPAPTAAVPARRDDIDRGHELDDAVDDGPETAGAGDDSVDGDFVPTRRGRGGYDPEADAIARAARYRFRQRTALGLVLSTLLFAAFAIVMSPMLWWACALSVLGLGAYLAYLRRQVRYEEDIRRRRASRLQGVRTSGEENPETVVRDDVRAGRRQGMDREAARALRRRAVVLDVDDEEPLFDHLDPFDAAAARTTRNRAAGGEIRRAAGE